MLLTSPQEWIWVVLKLPPPQDAVFDNAAFDTALDYGLDQEAVSETVAQAESPEVGMAAHNARNRKQLEKYVPSMQGNKYQVHWLR